MAYVKAEFLPRQYVTENGLPAEDYIIRSYIWDTSTGLAMYTDASGSGSATSFALSAEGLPVTAGGTPVDIYLDDSKIYKFRVFKSDGVTQFGPTIGPVYPSQGGGAGGSIATCKTVADATSASGPLLTNGSRMTAAQVAAAADTGATLKTTWNNTTSKVGGGTYEIKSRAQHRTDIGNPSWVPDGYANHYLLGGTTYVMVLQHEGCVNLLQCGAIRQSSYDNAVITTAADIESAVNNLPLYVPPGNGSFGLKQTVVRITQSAWTSQMDAGMQNSNAEASFYASIDDLGDNGVMVRCANIGVAGAAMRFRGIQFIGDADIDFEDLAAWDGTGLIGVDISHVRNGLDFFSCSFERLAAGCKQVTANPYVDHAVWNNCSFYLCGVALDGNSSGGFTFTNCRIFDCVDWINAPDCFLEINGTWFNNSSYSGDNQGIRAEGVNMTGGWTEGGQRIFYVTASCMLKNVYFSETYVASGQKYLCLGKDETYWSFEGCRFPSNTRIMDDSNITDMNTLAVEMKGCYGGVNWSTDVDIRAAIRNGMRYKGFGNFNAERFNTDQVDGHQLIGRFTDGTIDGEFTDIRHPRRILRTSNSSFQVECSPTLVEYATSNDRAEYVRIQLLGSDNGAGGTNAYEASLIIWKGYGSVWSHAITGTSTTAWTVALTNPTATSVDVEIADNHAGHGNDDLYFVTDASENVRLTAFAA